MTVAVRTIGLLDSDGEEFLTSPQMCTYTGATYRQIDFWCRAGYLPDNANGSGSCRRFTRHDAEVARLLVLLLNARFTMDRALIIASLLADGGEYRVHIGDGYHVVITRPQTNFATRPDGSDDHLVATS